MLKITKIKGWESSWIPSFYWHRTEYSECLYIWWRGNRYLWEFT